MATTPTCQEEKCYYGNPEQKQEMTFAMCVQRIYTRSVPARVFPGTHTLNVFQNTIVIIIIILY